MTKSRAGFTLAEMVVGMTITVVIALAVAGTAAALSSFSRHSEQYYEYLQAGRSASQLLQHRLSRAHLATAASDHEMIIWSRDDADTDAINVSEMTHVYLDPARHELIERRTVFPDALDGSTREALDDELELSDVTNVADAGKITPYPQYDTKRILARDVLAFSVRCVPPAPNTKVVKYLIVIGRPGDVVKIRGASRLRADKTRQVVRNGDKYVLVSSD
ncbi:MAG: prepilin-type N-terminal cleavage/methylation domain-containing protein [Planctomycetes bacterium]|nr:prepilin-type N-terminal cleavage/methylation domain-containing protein [Planctomycetota bacterium]